MFWDNPEGFSTLGPGVTLDPQNTDVNEILRKAYTPGTGIVQAGETTAAALRAQVLDPLLVASLYQTQDARFLQLLYAATPLRADSVAYEYTNMERYGDDKEAFVQDIGSAASTYAVVADQINTSDDVYRRYVKNSRFLGTRRIVSISAALSRSIVNPVAAAMVGATNEIIGKADAALYWGNPAMNSLHWEGLEFQIMNAYYNYLMTENSVNLSALASTNFSEYNQPPVIDAMGVNLADNAQVIQGQQIAEPLIQEAAARISEKFGEPSIVLVNPRVMQTISASLLAKERIIPSTQNGVAGVFTNVLVTSDGMPLQLVVDRLMQPGRSMIPHASLATSAEADRLPQNLSGVTVGSATATAGQVTNSTVRLARFAFSSWNNMAAGTAPSVTSNVLSHCPLLQDDSKQLLSYPANGGTGAVVRVGYKAYVIDGAGVVRAVPTFMAEMSIDGTNHILTVPSAILVQIAISAGLSNSPYDGNGNPNPLFYKNVRIKLYRSSPVRSTASTTTTFSQYKYVGDMGVLRGATSGWIAWFIDTGAASPWDANGASGPGAIGTIPLPIKPTTSLFVISLNKANYWNVRFLQFLPLMQRALPPAPLADQFAYLFFGTPIVRVPKWCAIIHNVAWDYAR